MVHETLVLSEARSRTERELVRRWTEAAHDDGTSAVVVPATPRKVASAIDDADPGTSVVPVRVVWPPDERAGSEPASLSDLLSLSARRRGVRRLHARVSGWSAERARVVAGEAATVEELRRACAEEVGDCSQERFVAFVLRRATLAADRAERRLTGDRYKVPRLMAEQITASAAVATRAEALAEKLGLSTEDVLAHTADCLTEMAAVQSPPAIETFRTVMSPMHSRAWDVDVDTSSLDRLRELGRTHPLVFLPSHRSYADPLVLAEVLHAHDFPRNHVLGGDNLAFWPLGALGRRAGIVFIRRSFGDDAIYKFAVREYLGHLLAKRFNLEWYIEGGRTRTGKLRPPKYGLLRYLIDAADNLPSDAPGYDPMLVPVSLHYDQLHEVGALAAEQGGAGKKAEGLGWLARFIRDQRRRIGSARVRFGEPISLRNAMAEAGEGSADSPGHLLEKVAFRISVGINRATPVTPTSAVTFALLGAAGRALTFEQVRAVVAPVLTLLDGGRGDDQGPDELADDAGLERTLARLEAVGVVERFDGGPETVWSIGDDRQHVAAYYRNGVLHHLLVRAVLETTLLGVVEAGDQVTGQDLVDACWAEALRLRDMLKYEFFFSRKRVFRDEMFAEIDRLDPDWRETTGSPGGAARLLARADLLVAPRALLPFLEAQWIVASVLADRGDEVAPDRAALLDAAVGLGQQWSRQHRLQGADTVSRELFSGALRAAQNRELIEDPGDAERSRSGTGTDDLAARRAAWRDEIVGVRDRLHRAASRENELLAEVLGADALA